LHVKDFASEKIPFYTNLVAMFYADLRIKRNPLTLYSLVKGIVISLGKAELVSGYLSNWPYDFWEDI